MYDDYQIINWRGGETWLIFTKLWGSTVNNHHFHQLSSE